MAGRKRSLDHWDMVNACYPTTDTARRIGALRQIAADLRITAELLDRQISLLVSESGDDTMPDRVIELIDRVEREEDPFDLDAQDTIDWYCPLPG